MELLGTIRQIGIFMICAQAVLHFKPAAKYEKYLKLLISVMVLVQLLNPLLRFFSSEGEAFFNWRIQEIGADMEKEMSQLQIENSIHEETILKETENKVKTQIGKIASENDLSVCSIQLNTQDIPAKWIVYVKDQEKASDINIHIERISTAPEVSAFERVEEEDTERNNKLQSLLYGVEQELGIRREEIEVVWYE